MREDYTKNIAYVSHTFLLFPFLNIIMFEHLFLGVFSLVIHTMSLYFAYDQKLSITGNAIGMVNGTFMIASYYLPNIFLLHILVSLIVYIINAISVYIMRKEKEKDKKIRDKRVIKAKNKMMEELEEKEKEKERERHSKRLEWEIDRFRSGFVYATNEIYKYYKEGYKIGTDAKTFTDSFGQRVLFGLLQNKEENIVIEINRKVIDEINKMRNSKNSNESKIANESFSLLQKFDNHFKFVPRPSNSEINKMGLSSYNTDDVIISSYVKKVKEGEKIIFVCNDETSLFLARNYNLETVFLDDYYKGEIPKKILKNIF